MFLKQSLQLCLMLVCVTSQPVSAQVFKCKGPDGKVGYQSSPCAETEITDKTIISKPNNSASVDSKSIYGIWVDVSAQEGEIEISQSGLVIMRQPGEQPIRGQLSQRGENRYHIAASLGDFDLSSDLRHDLETGELFLRMGPSVSSTFRKR